MAHSLCLRSVSSIPHPRSHVHGFSSSISNVLVFRFSLWEYGHGSRLRLQKASPFFRRRHLACASAWASPQPTLQQPQPHPQNEVHLSSSALAISAALKVAALGAVEVTQRADNQTKGLFSGPSIDFLELCQEQLAICHTLFGEEAKFTVCVRSAESYGTQLLELRQVAAHPKWLMEECSDTSILVCDFETHGQLHSAEAALLEKEAVELPDKEALVLPMVKDFFLVGVLVIEWIACEGQSDLRYTKLKAVRPEWPPRHKITDLQGEEQRTCMEKRTNMKQIRTFTQEQLAESKKVARSLAIACVMDQRTLLLQQSSWQRGVRIGDLLEKVRGPLAAIRTLGKMLQPQLKRGEISSDVLDDIIVQGERMKEVIQQFQEVIYFNQAPSNILKYRDNEVNDRGIDSSKTAEANVQQELDLVVSGSTPLHAEQIQLNSMISVGHSSNGDKEAPMPPVALAPLMHSKTVSCDVSKLLIDLVGTGAILAHRRGQALELKESPRGAPFLAAIDEASLRQAFSNLLDSSLQHTLPGGWVKVGVMQAPGGGVLVVIDDNGPDLTLMSQAQALAPLGSGLQVGAEERRDPGMILNFGAELTVAQDILEQYGGVLRITSPYLPKAPSGIGGTRLEVWLPAPPVE